MVITIIQQSINCEKCEICNIFISLRFCTMMKALLVNMVLITFIHIHEDAEEKWQSYMQMLAPSWKLKMRQKLKAEDWIIIRKSTKCWDFEDPKEFLRWKKGTEIRWASKDNHSEIWIMDEKASSENVVLFYCICETGSYLHCTGKQQFSHINDNWHTLEEHLCIVLLLPSDIAFCFWWSIKTCFLWGTITSISLFTTLCPVRGSLNSDLILQFLDA